MKVILLPRGTTLSFAVKLKDGNRNPYQMSVGDTLIMGVKHYVEHKNYEFSKELTSADYDDTVKGYVFKINPEDTQDFSFDDYYMDVGIELQSGDFYPVIPTHILRIEKMVTRKREPEPEPEPEPESEPQEEIVNEPPTDGVEG